MREGYLAFRNYETWYRVVGERDAPGKLPVLCLHGGPGSAHDYLEPLEALAQTGRRAVFYDQIGCGHSVGPDEAAFYTVELFVEEVGLSGLVTEDAPTGTVVALWTGRVCTFR